MSLAVEHCTVSLWPLNASPVSGVPLRPRKSAGVQHTPDDENPATRALAAITTGYRHGRADIISGGSSPSTGQGSEELPTDLAPAGHYPTVPVAFLSAQKPAEAPQNLPGDPAGKEATTLWSRLVRTGRPAPRGRHSPKG